MPFEKGKSGNPGGRRNDKLISDALHIALKEIDGDKTKARKLAERLVADALDGDNKATEIVLDRTEGKVPQALTGEDGGPIEQAIKYVYEFVEPGKADQTG